ncbi:MAG: hypothetical protein CM15mP62_10310 [Rhodospirillaceae bacterium]|nr:MAG: hypothetical protein CM15mP62_10310 [Rhodospirillaceae bacterium]
MLVMHCVRTVNSRSHLIVEDGEKVEAGKTLVRFVSLVGLGILLVVGLPCVTELFERVTHRIQQKSPLQIGWCSIVCKMIKRGNREIIIESKTGEIKKYPSNYRTAS